MKISFITKNFLLLVSIVILGFVTSCEKSGTEPMYQVGEYVKHVDDLTAFVRFNEELGEWYLYYHIPGSIDSVHDFYPGELDKAYQQEDMKVVFSGDIYNIDYKNTIPTTESFRIVLSSIREWTEETKETEEEDKLGYWYEDKFIAFQMGDPKKFLVQARCTDNPASQEEVEEILLSLGVETITAHGFYNLYYVEAQTRPQHPALFVSPQYKTSTAETDWLYVLPQIFICVATEEALAATLEKYGEHLELTGFSPAIGGTIYRFNSDFATSEEVLRLTAKIHKEPEVIWCESRKLAPIILD